MRWRIRANACAEGGARFVKRSIAAYALVLIAGIAGQITADDAAWAQPKPAASKLSLHLIDRLLPGAEAVVAAGPRVLKVLDPHASAEMVEAMRRYKAIHPDGKILVRIYTTLRFSLSDDAAVAAERFWADVLAPALNALSPQDRDLIDYLEGPNEHDTFPAWQNVQTAAWFGRFWSRLAEHIAAAGYLPCAGSIPVGNPPGSLAEMEAMIEAFVPALSAVERLGGAWSYHAYTPNGKPDLGQENWYSLRYRFFYRYFAGKHPELVDLPLILSEAGYDTGGGPLEGGWRANLPAGEYLAWLRWFDGELAKDPYVLGATLFQSGTTNWPSFETEPEINRWLAQYLTQSDPRDIIGPLQ